MESRLVGSLVPKQAGQAGLCGIAVTINFRFLGTLRKMTRGKPRPITQVREGFQVNSTVKRRLK